MIVSETTNLLKQKITRILTFLLVIRLGLYIPVPGVDLDLFAQSSGTNTLLGLQRNLTGSSFLGIGSLGILPYINASIIIQLLTPIIPALTKLQKEEGELGRQEIRKYTRYLTFFWALFLSLSLSFFLIKPLVFNWTSGLVLKIVLSLTTGSMLSLWFAERITNEDLGNGSSMIIGINILGGIPANFSGDPQVSSVLTNLSQLFTGLIIYLAIVWLIILVQGAYKRVNIVSARQLDVNYLESSKQNSGIKNSYIPIKITQSGIMPLVFSTTIVTFVLYPLQILLSSTAFNNGGVVVTLSFVLNFVLVIFFSSFYALLVLKPKDLSENLTKTSYSIPGLKQGKETTFYLKQVISRLAFLGGLFLAFLAFFPILLSNFFQISLFKNLTSLLILIGVLTDVSAQIKGYLVSQNYESYKKT
jgi:preprotein translocase subunit SecY|tara:strand:- start:191 stop:1441 length:1251 start_codon:yes stop_codon:yes gene_type:complete